MGKEQKILKHHSDPADVGRKAGDIAAAIGATPETLSRLILRLTQEGRIDWQGKTLKVLA